MVSQEPQSSPPSRRSANPRSTMAVLGLLVAIPGAIFATCQLRDRAIQERDAGEPAVEPPVAPPSAEPSAEPPVEPVEPAAAGRLIELPFEIDAVSLVRLYGSGNDVAANDLVRGRLLRVEGVVLAVPDNGQSGIVLRGPGYPASIDNVYCWLDADQRALARGITRGQTVTVTGTGAGESYRGPELTSCRIIAATTQSAGER